MVTGINPVLRRTFFFTTVLLTAGFASALLLHILMENGMTFLKGVQFFICTILFWEISFYFWNVAFGFFLLLFRPASPPAEEGPFLVPEPPPVTAVVMPIYNEDSGRVFAGLKAILDSIGEAGLQEQFHLHILSDTRISAIREEEERRFRELRQNGMGAVFYRNRRWNTARKMGNLRDFCSCHADRYKYMVVLDADSLVTGETLLEMVRRMEQNPGVALIQVPPFPVNQDSLFARIQQFSSAAYGPMMMAGLGYWQMGEANYWGHNAIIRIDPFLRHCRLPRLPGKEPFGGEIWSHDFLEAAMLRKAGWEVRLCPDLGGSYEELPPSLIDYAKRDRRWCQGNIQHIRFLLARGLHPISRLHLLMGILSYLTAPLWLFLLGVTGLNSLTHPGEGLTLYLHSRSELWPVLLGLVLIMLFFPRIMAFLLYAGGSSRGKSLGGPPRVFLSIFLETIFSFLLAPIQMMFKTQFVISTLLRSKIQWTQQRRGGRQTDAREALSAHRWHTVIGLVAAAAVFLRPDLLLWWFTPALLWLIFSIPISILLSLVLAGEKARELGLFLIPEEVHPPAILKFLRRHLRQSDPQKTVRWKPARRKKRFPMFLSPVAARAGRSPSPSYGAARPTGELPAEIRPAPSLNSIRFHSPSARHSRAKNPDWLNAGQN